MSQPPLPVCHMFCPLHRDDYGRLYDFVTAKSIKVKNKGVKVKSHPIVTSGVNCHIWYLCYLLLVHKQMYFIRMNLRRFQASNVNLTFEMFLLYHIRKCVDKNYICVVLVLYVCTLEQ